MYSEELPEINIHPFYNECEVHKEYKDFHFPCPYPNCKYGIESDSFIVKSTDAVCKFSNNTKYFRKEWKGIGGELNYKWNESKGSYNSVSDMVYSELHKIRKNKIYNIYHYTSIDSLYKIIDSNELWLTEYSYTNDPTEIDYGIKILNKLDIYNLNIENKIKSGNLNFFLTSFSYEVNKRTLFNEYANDAKGVAIEFDIAFNKENKFWYNNSSFTNLMPVVYQNDLQEKIINYAFYIFETCKQWLYEEEELYDSDNKLISKKEREDLLVSMLSSLLEEIIASFKDSSFSDEREIRWLYRHDKNFFEEHNIDSKIIKNQYKKNYYTSTDVNKMGYHEVHKKYYGKAVSLKLPIKKIILGSRVKNKNETIKEIKSKLTECDFNDVSIEISNLPYK